MELVAFGYLAAFFTAISFLPQAIKTIKTRDINGLSLLTYLFLYLGSLSWFIYGIVLTDVPLMSTNFLTTIFTGIILFLILSFYFLGLYDDKHNLQPVKKLFFSILCSIIQVRVIIYF